MNHTTLLIVLTSALGWSWFDISRKKLGSQLSPAVALFLYMLLSLPIFVIWALVSGGTAIGEGYWLCAIAGIVVNFFANWCFIESVSRSPLSLSVPMLAFVPALSAVFSFLILHETMATGQMVGIGIIVGGALLLNGFPKLRGASVGPWLMFVTAVLWAMLLVLDKICLRAATVPMHASLQTAGIIICTLLLMRYQRVSLNLKASLRMGGGYLWFGVLGCFMGGALQLVAMPMADVGIIEAVKRSANMFLSFTWGYWLFQESITLRKVVALSILLWGTFLVLQVV